MCDRPPALHPVDPTKTASAHPPHRSKPRNERAVVDHDGALVWRAVVNHDGPKVTATKLPRDQNTTLKTL
jgi:hypothetical protein